MNTQYEKLIDNPLNIIGDMSFDEYLDWLDLGNEEDLTYCLEVFKRNNIPLAYINILKNRL